MVLGLAAEACIITVCVKCCISFFQLSQTYEALTHSFAGNDMRVLTLAKKQGIGLAFPKGIGLVYHTNVGGILNICFPTILPKYPNNSSLCWFSPTFFLLVLRPFANVLR